MHVIIGKHSQRESAKSTMSTHRSPASNMRACEETLTVAVTPLTRVRVRDRILTQFLQQPSLALSVVATPMSM